MSDLISEIKELCPDTVTWEALASRDVYGKATYAAAQTFQGRRIYKTSRVRAGFRVRGEGAEVIADSEIIILATPDVKYEDHVYVQGDSEPYPPILNIERHSDETGPIYVKVILGSANG